MNFIKRTILVVFLVLLIIFLFIFSNIFETNLSKETKYKILEKNKNYNKKYKNRYIKFYDNNKNLDYEKIITYVNIGLDKGFYNGVESANTDDNYLILVNKFNKLSKDYEPNDLEEISNTNFINSNKHVNSLRKEAKNAFESLSNDSIKNGTPVYGQSAYRNYLLQERLYTKEVKNYGFSIADKQVARPGFSEHQTGLAIDVSSTKNGNMLDFENTDSYIWMKNNAYKYGFILRYPKDKEKIHGYIYEAWHFRYVGKKIAKDMYDNYNALTYDEYYSKFIENKKSN